MLPSPSKLESIQESSSSQPDGIVPSRSDSSAANLDEPESRPQTQLSCMKLEDGVKSLATTPPDSPRPAPQIKVGNKPEKLALKMIPIA